jgi:kexin
MWIIICFLLLASGSEWVLRLDKGIDPETFARDHDLTYGGALEFLDPGFYRFYDTSRNERLRSNRQHSLRGASGVRFAQEQVKKTFFRRGSVITDPMYEDQWHLHTHPFSVQSDLIPQNITGKGIRIAIVDDGLDHTHPEIHNNYDAMHSWDFNGQDADPRPFSYDTHGTAAAGVAAGVKDNGRCGHGVAHEASLVGIRLIAAGVNDATQAQGLTHQGRAQVDIYSCSWGPQDTGDVMETPNDLTDYALSMYTNGRAGRLGKGTIYVWAAGNGRYDGDSCAFDGYVSNPHTIAIGAIDYDGKQAWYSESCSALFAVTPSSGAQHKGIITCNSQTNGCMDTFGGTSSSAPLAAGIISMLLQKRPSLTYRDVREIIARGAVPIQINDGSWTMNRRGYRHSQNYGFGLLRLPDLLAKLEAYNQSITSDPIIVDSGLKPFGQGQGGGLPFNFTFHISDAKEMNFIEYVMVNVALFHPQRGRVVIKLTSPEGIVSELAPHRPRDRNPDYPMYGWRFTSVKHWGESQVTGSWILTVEDYRNEYHVIGAVSGCQLWIWGRK